MNPNDQNPNPPDAGPVADQPVQDVTSTEPTAQEPIVAEKCETCGADSNNGNCSGCSQPNASCTCPPKAPEVPPAEGGSAPAAPAM